MPSFAMSTSQRGLWFAQQLTPDVPFTIAQYLDLHGPLDADLIRAACNQAPARSNPEPCSSSWSTASPASG